VLGGWCSSGMGFMIEFPLRVMLAFSQLRASHQSLRLLDRGSPPSPPYFDKTFYARWARIRANGSRSRSLRAGERRFDSAVKSPHRIAHVSTSQTRPRARAWPNPPAFFFSRRDRAPVHSGQKVRAAKPSLRPPRAGCGSPTVPLFKQQIYLSLIDPSAVLVYTGWVSLRKLEFAHPQPTSANFSLFRRRSRLNECAGAFPKCGERFWGGPLPKTRRCSGARPTCLRVEDSRKQKKKTKKRSRGCRRVGATMLLKSKDTRPWFLSHIFSVAQKARGRSEADAPSICLADVGNVPRLADGHPRHVRVVGALPGPDVYCRFAPATKHTSRCRSSRAWAVALVIRDPPVAWLECRLRPLAARASPESSPGPRSGAV